MAVPFVAGGAPFAPAAARRVLGAATTAALLLAPAAHLVDRTLELALLDTALVALGVGTAVAWAVRRYTLASTARATAIALLGVSLALAGHLALDYAWVRILLEERAVELGRLLERYGLSAHTAAPTLPLRAYLAHRVGGQPSAELAALEVPAAADGGPLGTITQFLGCAALASFLARRPARQPACQRCGSFLRAVARGDAAFGRSQAFADALLSGATAAALNLLEPPDTGECMRLLLLRCPHGHGGGGGVLRILERTIDPQRRRHWRLRAHLWLRADEFAALAQHGPLASAVDADRAP